MPSARADDSGQVALLILVDTLVAIALVLVVASATTVHLARHRLQAVADGASLAAADALDRGAYFRNPPGAGRGPARPSPSTPVPVSPAGVQDAVRAYLAGNPSLRSLEPVTVLEPTGSPDGAQAVVTLHTVARLPLLAGVLPGWAGGIGVTVQSRARARAGR